MVNKLEVLGELREKLSKFNCYDAILIENYMLAHIHVDSISNSFGWKINKSLISGSTFN